MNTHSNSLLPDAAEDSLSERIRATWTAGDFGRIATGHVRGAAEFIARLGLTRDERVLDVACGTGNAALPAARSGAMVSGIDIAPNLIAQARSNAANEQLSIDFEVGDAEQLPFGDGAFDTVVTMFGAMFAGRPECAASELLRVTRSGGRIAMANWTPSSFIGRMLATTLNYAPPPASTPSPLLWGTEEQVQSRLGAGSTSITFARREISFEYPFSPDDVVNHFRLWYGPTLRTFAALDDDARAQLAGELTELWSTHNRAQDGTTRVQSEYLEVVCVVA